MVTKVATELLSTAESFTVFADLLANAVTEVSEQAYAVATGSDQLTDSIQEIASSAATAVGNTAGAVRSAQSATDLVARLSDNAKEIRAEAKDALSHYSDIIAGRQAQVINSLTIVATVFLPLSFLVGYFGMNFRILTSYVQNTLWEFILLGLLLMIASAALSLLLIHRLERHLKAGRIGQ